MGNIQQFHSGTKPSAYASLGDIQPPNPSSIENSLLPGPSYITHISKGQHSNVSQLWVAVSKNSKTILGSDISPGGLTKSADGFPLVEDLSQWKGPERSQRSQQRRRGAAEGQSSGGPGAYLQSALPMMSPAYLQLSQHGPVTAHAKCCLLGKLTGD